MSGGSRAPQVREAARLRLALLLDPALARLQDILRDKHHPQVWAPKTVDLSCGVADA